MEQKSELIRIQKYLSSSQVASRRKAEQMVEEGRIKINNKVACIGDKVNPLKDKIFVDGKIVKLSKGKKRYIILNKPRGYVTTLSDEKGRKCIKDLLVGIEERVYPVGRLDRNSEGLLIITNDGEFTNTITHPSKHIPKTYRVTLHSKLTDRHIKRLCEGVEIDGYKTAPADIFIVSEEQGRVVIDITIFEGKNRQIRKMCEAVNLEIARLKRVSIGNLKLGRLPLGKWRDLEKEEIKRILPPSDFARIFGKLDNEKQKKRH